MILDVKQLGLVRSIPTVALRLIEVMKDPEASIQAIADIVKADPAIAARILTTANSAMFGGTTEIKSLDRCILRLGKHTVCCLALSFSLTSFSNRPQTHLNLIRDCWLKSVIHALAMEQLAKRLGADRRSTMFALGLLADIGLLSLAEQRGAELTQLLQEADGDFVKLCELEKQNWGLNHNEITNKILSQWELPPIFAEVALYHEADWTTLTTLKNHPDFEVLAASSAASALAHFILGQFPARSFQRLELITNRVWNFEKQELDEWVQVVRGKLSETTEMFTIDLARLPSEHQLMAAAMEQLTKLAMEMAIAAQQKTEEDRKETQAMRAKLLAMEQRNCRDHLTQVYTREYFETRFTERVRNLKGNRTLGLLFADVDNFKKFNDTYGHLAGDEVLKQVGATLNTLFRADDVVARFGGEEFVILIDCPDPANIHSIAERMRQRIETTVVAYEGTSLSVTVSVGGVWCIPNVAPDFLGHFVRMMIKTADESLYHCKRNGRNRCQITAIDYEALLTQGVGATP